MLRQDENEDFAGEKKLVIEGLIKLGVLKDASEYQDFLERRKHAMAWHAKADQVSAKNEQLPLYPPVNIEHVFSYYDQDEYNNLEYQEKGVTPPKLLTNMYLQSVSGGRTITDAYGKDARISTADKNPLDISHCPASNMVVGVNQQLIASGGYFRTQRIAYEPPAQITIVQAYAYEFENLTLAGIGNNECPFISMTPPSENPADWVELSIPTCRYRKDAKGNLDFIFVHDQPTEGQPLYFNYQVYKKFEIDKIVKQLHAIVDSHQKSGKTKDIQINLTLRGLGFFATLCNHQSIKQDLAPYQAQALREALLEFMGQQENVVPKVTDVRLTYDPRDVVEAKAIDAAFEIEPALECQFELGSILVTKTMKFVDNFTPSDDKDVVLIVNCDPRTNFGNECNTTSQEPGIANNTHRGRRNMSPLINPFHLLSNSFELNEIKINKSVPISAAEIEERNKLHAMLEHQQACYNNALKLEAVKAPEPKLEPIPVITPVIPNVLIPEVKPAEPLLTPGLFTPPPLAKKHTLTLNLLPTCTIPLTVENIGIAEKYKNDANELLAIKPDIGCITDQHPRARTPKPTVIMDCYIQEAAKIVAGKHIKPLVIVFANGFKPGDTGKTCEGSLVSSSNASQAIPKDYDHGIVLSFGGLFMISNAEMTVNDTKFHADLAFVSMPNLGKSSTNKNLSCEGVYFSSRETYLRHVTTLFIMQYKLASLTNNIMITGRQGCGVYNNDDEDVAAILYAVSQLEEFKHVRTFLALGKDETPPGKRSIHATYQRPSPKKIREVNTCIQSIRNDFGSFNLESLSNDLRERYIQTAAMNNPIAVAIIKEIDTNIMGNIGKKTNFLNLYGSGRDLKDLDQKKACLEYLKVCVKHGLVYGKLLPAIVEDWAHASTNNLVLKENIMPIQSIADIILSPTDPESLGIQNLITALVTKYNVNEKKLALK